MPRAGIGVAMVVLAAGVAALGLEGERKPGPPKRPPPDPPPKASPPSKPAAPPEGSTTTFISGRVVSRSGNALPEGLSIRAHGWYPEKSRGVTATLGEDGSFRVEGVWSGCLYDLSVELGAFGPRFGGTSKLAAGSKDLLVTLDPCDSIRGIVVDAEGVAVGPGIAVHADAEGWCGNKGLGEWSACRTGKDGRFVLEFLRRFHVSVMAARGEGLAKEGAKVRRVPPGSTELVLRLGPVKDLGPVKELKWGSRDDGPDISTASYEPAATAVTGRLIPPSGSELRETYDVELVPEGGGPSLGARSLPSGYFDTGTLPKGKYSVRIKGPGGLPCAERKGVETGARRLEFALDSLGTISGQVFDPSGIPVGAGVMVKAEVPNPGGPGRWSDATTREDGTFLIEYLGDFAFDVKAISNDDRKSLTGSWPVAGVKPGTKGVALHLETTVSVSGRVVDAVGNPIARSYVKAFQGRVYESGDDSAQTDEKGGFLLSRLARGRVRLKVHWNGSDCDLGEHDAPAEGLELRLPAK